MLNTISQYAGPILLALIIVIYYGIRIYKHQRYVGSTIGIITEIYHSPHSYHAKFEYYVDGTKYEGSTAVSCLQIDKMNGHTIPVQYNMQRPEAYIVPDPFWID